jgi:hypothetical protein
MQLLRWAGDPNVVAPLGELEVLLEVHDRVSSPNFRKRVAAGQTTLRYFYLQEL